MMVVKIYKIIMFFTKKRRDKKGSKTKKEN